jgi:exopolysaccharide production protein ExoQ
MPRQLILLVCIAFVAWLFVRDRRRRPMTSGWLWLPTVWYLIIASRPVSLWFGGGQKILNPSEYLEGSPFDRNVYLLLIAVGIGVLMRRAMNWGRLFSANSWVVWLFAYYLVSVVWSDFAFVGLKRWIKDLGNVVMVVVLLTERDPAQAFRALMARATYICVPFSVVTIKYYGEIGRYVTSSWDNALCGIATEKNALGLMALIAGVFLVWDFFEERDNPSYKRDRVDLGSRVLLMLMVFWLIQKADSSTALVCLILGSFLVVFMRTEIARRLIRYLGTYALVVALGLFLFISVPGLLTTFLEILGEDVTLTGRTELWGELMAEKLNPLLGAGYQSFWLGPRAEVYWEKWSFHPNQAHNGYLETYLNGGLLALGLIVGLLLTTAARLKRKLIAGSSFARILFAYFVIILLYNWTEAMFNKMSPIWFVQLLTATVYPMRRSATASVRTRGTAGQKLDHEIR